MLLAGLALATCAATADDPRAPAAGGAPLLRAAEDAAQLLLGTIEGPRALDATGWTAVLRVERDLDAPGPVADGTRQRIAWEELAPGRAARFRAEERVLVALEPLPAASLWRRRFPEGDARAVAAAGAAFLRAPDAETTGGLAAWRALPAAEREDTAGARALAALVARAAPPIALAAVQRLAELPGLASRLDADATALLATALGDASRPLTLRVALVDLAGARGLATLRPALDPLAQAGAPLAGPAWDAIARLDGTLPEPTLRALLDESDPAVRTVAVRVAADTALAPRAADLARRDPAAEVRAAAVAALLAPGRDDAHLELGFAALSDPAPAVRAAAAVAVGARGAAVVPRLRALAEERRGAQASGALTALGYAGSEGQAALRALAHEHPDPATRQLARLIAGLPLQEH